jgi:hypothetical protein
MMSYFILTIYNLSTSPCVNSSIGLLVLVTGVHRENHWPAASLYMDNVSVKSKDDNFSWRNIMVMPLQDVKNCENVLEK